MKRHTSWFAPALIVAVATAVRLIALGKPSFSVDESSSLFFSTYPEIRAVFWDNHPPLYHLVLKGWLLLAPLTEVGARSLSVVCSGLGVVALYLASCASGNRQRGLFAAGLLALSSLSIRYAQEVRMYAMMEAAACAQLASLLYFLAHLESLRAKRAFILTSFAGVFTHVFGVVSTLILLPAFNLNDFRSQRKWLAFAGVAGLIFMVGFAFFQFDARFIEWQKIPYQLGESPLSFPKNFLLVFTQNDWAVFAVVTVAAFFSLRHHDVLQRRLARTILASILLIVCFGLCGEWVLDRRFLIPRYFIFLNPFLIWVTVLGFEVLSAKIVNRWLRLAFVSALVVGYAAMVPKSFQREKQAWRDIANVVNDAHAELVMSTKPRGFQVPYYSARAIPYETFVYAPDFATRVRGRLEKFRVVAIVDDNLNRLDYFNALTLEFARLGVRTATYDIASEEAGSVFAIIAYR